LTAANNVRAHRSIEFCVCGFESYPEHLRTLMRAWNRGILGNEASKSGIKLVQGDQALPRLVGQKERRIGVQAAEEILKNNVVVGSVNANKRHR
jgi:hypothetical protein